MKHVLLFLTALLLISLDSLYAVASDSPIDIVKASVDWFFEAAERWTVKGRPCRNWGYAFEKPIRRSEDIGHGGKDIEGLYRADLAGCYGITRQMMEGLANTAADVIVTGQGQFAGQVSGAPGKTHPKRRARTGSGCASSVPTWSRSLPIAREAWRAPPAPGPSLVFCARSIACARGVNMARCTPA